jgi:hypothetical protein
MRRTATDAAVTGLGVFVDDDIAAASKAASGFVVDPTGSAGS